MASQNSRGAPRMEFGRWSYISRLSWTVLASILEGLGVDFVPLGVHLGSNLAAKIAPELPKSAQEPPKSRPRTAKSRPRQPKSAQDSPRAAQELPMTAQEPPKSRPRCPGAAQDLTREPPRSCQEPGPKPRITHDLNKNSQLHHALL